jgi:hypothetical protein
MLCEMSHFLLINTGSHLVKLCFNFMMNNLLSLMVSIQQLRCVLDVVVSFKKSIPLYHMINKLVQFTHMQSFHTKFVFYITFEQHQFDQNISIRFSKSV